MISSLWSNKIKLYCSGIKFNIGSNIILFDLGVFPIGNLALLRMGLNCNIEYDGMQCILRRETRETPPANVELCTPQRLCRGAKSDLPMGADEVLGQEVRQYLCTSHRGKNKRFLLRLVC